MTTSIIPVSLESLLAEEQSLEMLFTQLMPEICRALNCERCLLFLRDPITRKSRCSHGWWDRPEHAYPLGTEWVVEPETLGDDDPLFGEALRNPEALFVEDIETAGAEVLNLAFEQQYFGHSALIHAPFYHAGQMFGILEPCAFDGPHTWTESDRRITAWLQEKLSPLAAIYIKEQSK